MRIPFLFWGIACLAVILGPVFPNADHLPVLGRDSVLVYRNLVQDSARDFVIRIAEFSPDRYFEWEDRTNQGTVFIPMATLEKAKGYTDSDLFSAGVDKEGDRATTIWLSRKIYQELKEKKKTKLDLDSIPSWISLEAIDTIPVEINGKIENLPAIKTIDGLKAERWFLDSEENPLLLKHQTKYFTQTLASITTNRPNTLRWIKGKKLNRSALPLANSWLAASLLPALP